MPMKEVSPQEAYRLMREEGYIYLDVRTEREYEEGHVKPSYNIPVVFREPGMDSQPNPLFLEVVGSHFPKDTKLIVGCRSGGRSAKAQQMLLHAGYQDVINDLHGWEGRTDWDGTFLPGWSLDSSLPSEQGHCEGFDYPVAG